MRLKNKTALITGGTTGIGFATARKFLSEGATVIITGQDGERLAKAEQTLAKEFDRISSIRWQAEQLDSSTDVAAFVQNQSGLDIVFANAGVTWPAPFGEIDPEHMQKQLLVNVTAPMHLLQKLVPMMHQNGSIIMNTSCLDEMGMPGMGAYSASKAALRSLVRTLAAELEDKHIRVNSVAPGPVETPIYSKLGMPDEALEAMAAEMTQLIPIGRFAKPEEIAEAVTFLASDASSYMQAEEIKVDGGWTNI